MATMIFTSTSTIPTTESIEGTYYYTNPSTGENAIYVVSNGIVKKMGANYDEILNQIERNAYFFDTFTIGSVNLRREGTDNYYFRVISTPASADAFLKSIKFPTFEGVATCDVIVCKPLGGNQFEIIKRTNSITLSSMETDVSEHQISVGEGNVLGIRSTILGFAPSTGVTMYRFAPTVTEGSTQTSSQTLAGYAPMAEFTLEEIEGGTMVREVVASNVERIEILEERNTDVPVRIQLLGDKNTPETTILNTDIWVRNEPAAEDSTIGIISFARAMTNIIVVVAESNSSGGLTLINRTNAIPVNGESIDLSSYKIKVNAGQYVGIRADNRGIYYSYGGGFDAFGFSASAIAGNSNNNFVAGLNFTYEITLESLESVSVRRSIIDIKGEIANIESGKIETGLVWNSIGDSITEADRTGGYLNNLVGKGYQSVVNKELNFTRIANAAVGGTKMTSLAASASRLAAEIVIADIYTVFLGINDFSNTESPRIGRIADYSKNTFDTPPDPENPDTTGPSFFGAMRKIIDTIYSRNNKAKIIFITPFYKSKDVNYNTFTQVMYNDAIKEACAYDSIPVLDMLNEGLYNRVTRDLFTSDGTHPNETGHQVIGARVTSKLKEVLGV